jgi:Transposase, Mutator family
LFKYFLENPPVFQVKQREKAHLIIDGTYFSNDLCLVLYRDNDIKNTLLYRFSNGEKYEEIYEDLKSIALIGVQIESITCDGHKATLKAIRKAYPDIITQRCIVHVHRMANIWLRQKPKTKATIELKKIANLLPLVKTVNDRTAFIRMFEQWHIQYKTFVNEKAVNQITGRWWYRHKTLKRATTLIHNALPDLFHFLDNQQIPKSTNGLESFFGHLKDNLSIHRGLSYKNRKAFILWYLHFKNQSGK